MGAGRYGTSLRDIFRRSISVLSREKLNDVTKATEFITLLHHSIRTLVFFPF